MRFTHSGPAPTERNDAKTLKTLLPYLLEFKGRVALALSLLMLAKLANVSVPWFLMLQGSPNKGGQSPTYELQRTADIDQISQEMASSAAIDLAVAIPAVFKNGRQKVTLYVRPDFTPPACLLG